MAAKNCSDKRSRFRCRSACGGGTADIAQVSWATRKCVPRGQASNSLAFAKTELNSPLRSASARFNRGIGSLVCTAIRDITDRKRIEERLRRLLDSAPDAMVIAGNDGRIVLVNTQTERLFGYKREELLGQPVELLVPERFWKHHRAHRGNYMVNPQARARGAGNELYGLKKDGTEFPVEISLSPQQTDEGVLRTTNFPPPGSMC
jgi:PAS domain S-box-containing protein